MQKHVARELGQFEDSGYVIVAGENTAWWKKYWQDVPEIELPDSSLEELYYLGLYKFAGLTNPAGVPGTLQGPWIEEYRMPPWSSDYHFNINVQMCYWPAFKANRPEHLRPLFELVWSWREQFRRNARLFIGIDDGYMLSHAVDDHCTSMGAFWSGIIDHACSAWMAQMMFHFYLYTGDKVFLGEIALPFMKGTMRVFEAMLEKDADGAYSLPVSVSPEYHSTANQSWGRNSSFQIAAVRALAEYLLRAADALGEDAAPVWRDILEKLPPYCLITKDGEERIALWEGTDLEYSHRHHSHLGGICPFDTIDIYSKEHLDIVRKSIFHWIRTGMGEWSGWSLPWAAMLHARCGNGDMAGLMLEIMSRVFMNQGHGSLHDAAFPGFSTIGSGNMLNRKYPGEVALKPNRDTLEVISWMRAWEQLRLCRIC